jgi:anti-sigma factor RsiW
VTHSGRTSHVEQHLGDRLAALVDGELEHDARERVLAHLATCCTCKAEADEQRRLKSVFVQMAPPPPSEGLIARLQNLPGTDGDGPGTFGSHGGSGLFAMGAGGFTYVPARGQGRRGDSGPARDGFPIHDLERSASRGRRFAFAAAGAMSLAAIALGGALPLEAAVDSATGRGEGTGPATSPARTAQAADAASVTGGDAVSATGADVVAIPLLFGSPGRETVPPAASVTTRILSGPQPTSYSFNSTAPVTAPVTATALSPLIHPVAPGPLASLLGQALTGADPSPGQSPPADPAPGPTPVLARSAPSTG